MAATIAVGLGFAIGAQAQTTTSAKRSHAAASEAGRDVVQQKRIEQGLQSGQLTSGEARGLEAGEAHLEKIEQRDLRDGSLSASERAQFQHQQNRESRAIHGQKQTRGPAIRIR